MKVIEVQFDGHVRMPDSQRATNVMRCTGARDNALGGSVVVDSLEIAPQGILVTKTVEKESKLFTFRRLYAWNTVNEVVYEPEIYGATESDSSQSQPVKAKK